MTDNPYQSPDHVGAEPISDADDYRLYLAVDGDCLVVPTDTRLPERCIETNEPLSVPPNRMDIREFGWCPAWAAALGYVVLGPFGLIIAYKLQPKCRLIYAVSRSVRRRYIWRAVFAAFALLVSILAIPVGVSLSVMPLWIGGLVGVVLATTILLFSMTPLKVARRDGDLFWVRGCSPQFLQSVANEQSA
jgi:hypothetical protein